ncbi:MAG TPA: DUF488 family protein [Caulobacteraceae bacterium]
MRARKLQFRLKRAYDPPEPGDGVRVLVDRLWPRGLRRDGAQIDLWLKDVAPSANLRRWFGHDPARFAEFSRRYQVEMDQLSEPLRTLRQLARKGTVTLLFGAKDREHNQAMVLAARLRDRPSATVAADR